MRYGFRAGGEGKSKEGELSVVGGGDGKGVWEQTRGEGMGKEVKKRVLVGSYALSAE